MRFVFTMLPERRHAALDLCKYVVAARDGEETMLVFGSNLIHREMVRDALPDHEVVSAGFLRADAILGGYVCRGRSESLGADSRPGIDGPALNAFLEASADPAHRRFLV